MRGAPRSRAPRALGYLRAFDAPSDDLAIAAVTGPHADALLGHRLPCVAYHSQPVMHGDGLRSLLGIAFGEPRLPSAHEVGGLESAAAIAELALGR